MPLDTSQYPRLANIGDLPRLLSGDRVTEQWPPPGTTVIPLAFPNPWVLVVGEPTEGVDGDWYVTTLSEMLLGVPDIAVQILARISALWTGPLAGFGSTVGAWPIIYEVGRVNFMRWIRCTFRGDLAGGVEQFQHKMDLGLPGADPDITAPQALALAEVLAGLWGDVWAAGLSAGFSANVRYLEVGVTQCTQTDGTDVDGGGGNLEQSFETEWFAYPSGSRPAGTAGGVSLPFEVSCAVTLQTDVRGARGRGRFYLPPFTVTAMSAGGIFQGAYVDMVNTAVASLFTEIIADTPHVPVVVSRRGIILNEITEVFVGRVPDAQRRRRRSQDEARVLGYVKA